MTVYVAAGPKELAVPDVTGLPLSEVEGKLTETHFALGSVATENSPSVAENLVISMDPAAGTMAAPGTRVSVTVSSGKVAVPDVTGQTLQAARALLTGLNLQVTPVPRDCETTGPGLPIVAQSIVGNQPQGSNVDIVYCTGGTDEEPSEEPEPAEQ